MFYTKAMTHRIVLGLHHRYGIVMKLFFLMHIHCKISITT